MSDPKFDPTIPRKPILAVRRRQQEPECMRKPIAKPIARSVPKLGRPPSKPASRKPGITSDAKEAGIATARPKPPSLPIPAPTPLPANTGGKRSPSHYVTAEGKEIPAERIGSHVAAKPPDPQPGVLYVHTSRSDTQEAVTARLLMSPAIQNTITAMTFNSGNPLAKNTDGTAAQEINSVADEMIAKLKGLETGDLKEVEQHLLSQAIALQAMFSEMVRRGAANMGTHMGAMETYMRLALKAQSQCRTTLETLAEIKNPRPVFARNFNLANGNQQVNSSEGPQQVNNGVPTRAEKPESPANKLLETK